MLRMWIRDFVPPIGSFHPAIGQEENLQDHHPHLVLKRKRRRKRKRSDEEELHLQVKRMMSRSQLWKKRLSHLNWREKICMHFSFLQYSQQFRFCTSGIHRRDHPLQWQNMRTNNDSILPLLMPTVSFYSHPHPSPQFLHTDHRQQQM